MDFMVSFDSTALGTLRLSPNELVDATEPAVEDSSTGQLRPEQPNCEVFGLIGCLN